MAVECVKCGNWSGNGIICEDCERRLRGNEEIIEHIAKKIPYPEQIKEWDLETEQGAVRFTWRGDRFRVSSSLTVEQVEGGLLRGSNIAILLQKILKK